MDMNRRTQEMVGTRGKPGVLQSSGCKVRDDWAPEQARTVLQKSVKEQRAL